MAREASSREKLLLIYFFAVCFGSEQFFSFSFFSSRFPRSRDYTQQAS